MKKIYNLLVISLMLTIFYQKSIFAMDGQPNAPELKVFNAIAELDAWTNAIRIKPMRIDQQFEPFAILRDKMNEVETGDDTEKDPIYTFTLNEKKIKVTFVKENLQEELNQKPSELAKNSFLITNFKHYDPKVSFQGDFLAKLTYSWNRYGCGDERDTFELNIRTHPFWIKSEGGKFYNCSELFQQHEANIRKALDEEQPFILTLQPTYPGQNEFFSEKINVLFIKFEKKPTVPNVSGSGLPKVGGIDDVKKSTFLSRYLIIFGGTMFLALLAWMYKNNHLNFNFYK